MFMMEKGVGWKERGAGILKVNVPQSSVEFDHQNNPMPESFDASVLDDEESKDGSKGRKSVRLIMRQDHTLRVILNTVILPSTDFILTTKLKSSFVLFMAFEGTEVKQIQMKVSPDNSGVTMMAMFANRYAVERGKCQPLHQPDEDYTTVTPGRLSERRHYR